MDKHFIIYKTTNRLNGRYYIGMHECVDLDDGYLGSGRRIKAEIKKYGRENFVRGVLQTLASREEMKFAEEALVNEKLLTDPTCLNLKNGGEGGGRLWSDEHREKFIRSTRTAKLRGTARASEIARKAGETRRKNGTTAKGNKNLSAFHVGTRWMNNGVVAKKVPRNEIDAYLSDGFKYGML